MSDPAKAPSYHHDHTGVSDLGWDGFGECCRDLVEKVAADYRPEVVVGIAKGGVLPAVVVSSALFLDFFPIKLSSRHNEVIVRETPEVHVRPGPEVRGRRVLLVDDIAVTMRTLHLARSLLDDAGATEIRTATLAVHHGAEKPDWWALETQDLILMPWDRDVLRDREWQLNPEYADELRELGRLDDFRPRRGTA